MATAKRVMSRVIVQFSPNSCGKIDERFKKIKSNTVLPRKFPLAADRGNCARNTVQGYFPRRCYYLSDSLGLARNQCVKSSQKMSRWGDSSLVYGGPQDLPAHAVIRVSHQELLDVRKGELRAARPHDPIEAEQDTLGETLPAPPRGVGQSEEIH